MNNIEITDRIINGAVLTLDYTDKVGYLNKYKKDNTEISFELAKKYVDIGLVGFDSGFDDWDRPLKEDHYLFSRRLELPDVQCRKDVTDRHGNFI